MRPPRPQYLGYNPQESLAGQPAPGARSKPITGAFSANSYGVRFNNLYILANMPIQRFGSMLISKGYVRTITYALLRNAALDANLDSVMCRSLISVDYGASSMTAISTRCSTFRSRNEGRERVHLSDLLDRDLAGPGHASPGIAMAARPDKLELRRRAQDRGE
jgi:hypothetical protein